MYASQAIYRDLFEAIHRKDRRPLYWRVLAPWVESHGEERAWLRSMASRTGNPVPQLDAEELYRLYALGRINEILLLRFQQGRADSTDWPGPEISAEEYRWFAESLGLTVTELPTFSPFYHEIVAVEPAEDDRAPIALVSVDWPCLMLGDLMFSRAGVRVTGGRAHIGKEVAESSTLYWAYRRKNRRCQDLSHGWGSNSQWRTAFRRDYRIGRDLYYNVDGKYDLATEGLRPEPVDDVSGAERIELLTNRCFITTMKADDDLWPYSDMLHVTVG